MDTTHGQPLIVIVGPTASGKTGVAIKIAERLNGEIICADSRTVYEGMSIGTAKPTPEEQARVPHWGLDLVKPGERFSAGQFKEYALGKIADIRLRNKLPILVGGTGLYIDGVVFDYQFQDSYDDARRKKLNTMTEQELYKYCVENNISLPENEQNKRHLVRAIERSVEILKTRKQPIANCYVVGIATNQQHLSERIEVRSEQLFKNGVVHEATMLGKKYGWESEAMTGNIYPIIRAYLEHGTSLVKAIDLFTTSDKQLAKRQMTWFRRNPFIMWSTLTEVEDYIYTVLAHE